jgi:hypothetical protein
MNEPMNMATKTIMVQEVGTPDEIKSCINEKGQWHEPDCDRVLLNHGFLAVELGLEKSKVVADETRGSDHNGKSL